MTRICKPPARYHVFRRCRRKSKAHGAGTRNRLSFTAPRSRAWSLATRVRIIWRPHYRAGAPWSLEATLTERTAALDRALCDDADICCNALSSPSAQWGVMRHIASEIGASTDTRLYAGQNRDGSAWTQLSFSPGGPLDYDALFYRIESRGSGAAEFTLRQYQKPADSKKGERLIRSRKIFGEAVSESACPVGFDTSPRYARRGAQEAKIAQVTIPDATPAELIAYLPPVHRRFAERIKEAGWPLGPG